MDVISLTGLKVYAYHGVLESEKEAGQEFFLDFRLFLDTSKAGAEDDLTKTVNYAAMAELGVALFTKEKYDLIETAAHKLAEGIITEYPILRRVEVTVNKPHAPIGIPFDNVSVTVSREWTVAYVAVGSNMGDSEAIIGRALDSLKARNDIRVLKESTIIRTKPYGGVEQDDFLNGMWQIETILKPEELLKVLNEIEKQEKRERVVHWGPRTLDLDIIYYGDAVMNTEKLNIPHIDMANRSFVLEPLNEIAPYVKHPVTGLTPGQMLERL